MKALGSATAQLLKSLSPSTGEWSFEELVRRLLARAAGVPIRRASSGQQHGIDALAEIPFAIEDKRYTSKKSLDARKLCTQMDMAGRRYPDLQLWVLVITVPVSADDRAQLSESAWEKGLGLLVLDPVAADGFLDQTDALAALCATEPSLTLDFLTRAPLEGSAEPPSQSDLAEVEIELAQIRQQARFEKWVKYLRTQLQDQQPIWQRVVCRHNERLIRQIEEAARENFGTSFEVDKVIPRSALEELDSWFEAEQTRADPQIAVVLGERYDGKTWLVFDWLRRLVAKLSIPIFFVPSKQGLSLFGNLDRVLAEQLEKSVPLAQRRHVPAWIDRRRDGGTKAGLWALLVFDGLNEYGQRDESVERLFSNALGLGELATRRAAILATTRSGNWSDVRDLLDRLRRQSGARKAALIGGQSSETSPTIATIPLQPFDDEEFKNACDLYKLSAEDLRALPATALPMLRKPRYLGLLLAHRHSLNLYSEVTVEVLHSLDLQDKMGRRSRHREGVWNEEKYQALLKRLAELQRGKPLLPLTEINDEIRRLCDAVDDWLSDLTSEGVLKATAGGYQVEASRLTLGHALFVLQELATASNDATSLENILSDALAPLAETDEGVAVIRAAATLALLVPADRPYPQSVVSTLIAAWFGSRNVSQDDLEAMWALRRLLIEPLLNMIPHVWKTKDRRRRLRDAYRMVLGDALTSRREEVRAAVASWFRLVPAVRWAARAKLKMRAATATNDVKVTEEVNALEAETRLLVAAESLKDLELEVRAGLDVARLQDLGLYLLSRCPGLVGPEDLLALTVSRKIDQGSIDSGDRFILRWALETVDRSWFVSQLERARASSYRLSGLRSLLNIADRADLQGLVAALPEPERSSLRDRNREGSDQEPAPEMTETSSGPIWWLKEQGCAVRDPNLPKPDANVLACCSKAINKHLRGAQIGDDWQTTGHDLDFKNLLLPMAAWIPHVGAKLIGYQLRSFPRCLVNEERLFENDLLDHAVLLRGRERRAVLDTLKQLPADSQRWAWMYLIQCLLPGANAAERVELLLNHPGSVEPQDLFDLAAELATPRFIRLVRKQLETEQDFVRKRRLRLLLAWCPKTKTRLSTRIESALRSALETESGADLAAAIQLAYRYKVTGIGRGLLERIGQGERARDTNASKYALALLRASQPETEDQAKRSLAREATIAARSETQAIAFLERISDAIEEFGRKLERRGSPDEKPARQGSAAFEEAWQNKWFSEDLSVFFSEERLQRWLDVWEINPSTSRRCWGGLIGASFCWALRTGSRLALRAWPLVLPFHRERFSSLVGWLEEGVDTALVKLNKETADDEIASALLQKLIADVRSSWELLQIALAALVSKTDRLERLALSLLRSPEAWMRGRAAALLGWLAIHFDILAEVEKTDQSLWVRRVAAWAHTELGKRDRWSQHWLDRFLVTDSVEERWGAAQLFIECATPRLDFWAYDRIAASAPSTRRRGEALLLLQAAQARVEKETKELKRNLLETAVSSLETVVHPWRRDDDWALRHR